MFTQGEEYYVYEKKKTEFFYCAKCESAFVVRKVVYNDDLKAGIEEFTNIEFCPFCGWRPK
jgi:hypothetical protein